MKRRASILRTWCLGLSLGLAAPAVWDLTPQAVAQEELPPEGEGGGEGGSGKPIYGYLTTALLGGIAIFALCKSARR
jgi:hypothetical protein